MSKIKLVKRIKYAGDVHAALMELGWDAETAAAFLDDIPDAAAVEVVRCKDCKHSYKGSPHGLMCECPVGGQNTSLLGGDDFCSNGERRADDGN